MLSEAEVLEDASLCMTLVPPREYLVTTSDSIYYCNATATPGCVIDTPWTFYPNIDVVRQFSGGRNKQYVLLSATRMRHGVTDSGYHVLQLVPKSSNPRGYVMSFTASVKETTMAMVTHVTA